MLIFPRLTQLDMTGPYEVLARLPNTTVHLVAHTHGAGEDRSRHGDRADRDLRGLSAARCGHGAGRSGPAGPDGRRGGARVPAAAGGAARNTSRRSAPARWCWAPRACSRASARPAIGRRSSISRLLGAIPVSERVVIDGNIVTGAGVASGIDFALQACGHPRRREGGARDPACRSSTIRIRRSMAARPRPRRRRRSRRCAAAARR